MSDKQDFTGLLERLEVFEERLGVTIESLKAEPGVRWGLTGEITAQGIIVFGQVKSREGLSLPEAISVVADVHDLSGRIIATDNHYILPEKFYGFETFKIFLPGVNPEQVSKVRIYPRKM